MRELNNDQYPCKQFRRDGNLLSGSFFDVHEIADDKRFVVKELRELSPLGLKGGVIERVKSSAALLEKYFEPYLPRMQFVVGRRREGKEPTLFIVQEKIEKQPLNFETILSPNELSALDDFVCRMIEMYRDTYDPRRDVGKVPEAQFGGSGMLLGSAIARPNEERRFYLVDVYPTLSLEPFVFQQFINGWITFLEDQQERIGNGWQLVKLKSREALENALLEIYQKQISGG